MRGLESKRMGHADVKLTVTITNYNQKEYIEEAVDSIINQDIGYSYEILIGDDGSTDGSWELLQEKYGADNRIKLYRMPRDNTIKEFPSWRHSRIVWFLLSQASGEYIAILDGDDFYCSRDGFKRKIDFLDQEENGDCVACASTIVFKMPDREDVHKIPDALIYKKLTIQQVFFSKERFYFPAASCLFRSLALKNVDFEKAEINGTDQSILYFFLHYGKVFIMPECDFAYRILADSLWHKGNDAEHAVRQVINFNIARLKFHDFYFRRLWKDRKPVLYVYRNRKSIPEQIDWETWKGFADKYHLEIIKWLMGERDMSLKIRVEMRISVVTLMIFDIPLKQKCRYVGESIGFLLNPTIPAEEKRKRLRAATTRKN